MSKKKLSKKSGKHDEKPQKVTANRMRKEARKNPRLPLNGRRAKRIGSRFWDTVKYYLKRSCNGWRSWKRGKELTEREKRDKGFSGRHAEAKKAPRGHSSGKDKEKKRWCLARPHEKRELGGRRLTGSESASFW